MILTMAASQQNRISWIASLRGLMIGTSEGNGVCPPPIQKG